MEPVIAQYLHEARIADAERRAARRYDVPLPARQSRVARLLARLAR